MSASFEIEGVEVIHNTGKALLVSAPIFDEHMWVPHYAITDDSEVWEKGQEPGTLVITERFAEEKGWL